MYANMQATEVDTKNKADAEEEEVALLQYCSRVVTVLLQC
jgi:hypothetical protein